MPIHQQYLDFGVRKRENKFMVTITIIKYLVISLIQIAQKTPIWKELQNFPEQHIKRQINVKNYASEWEYCKDSS